MGAFRAGTVWRTISRTLRKQKMHLYGENILSDSETKFILVGRKQVLIRRQKMYMETRGETKLNISNYLLFPNLYEL